MNLTDDTGLAERRQFFDGERLFADDLNDREAYHRELRWLHNRSLHQPGIGNGYAVVGAKNDREVLVGPGYALDVAGREIVLTAPRRVPVPPEASDLGPDQRPNGRPVFFYLTVTYSPDADLPESEFRQSACSDKGGAVRLAESPSICWVRLTIDETRTKYVPRNLDHRDQIEKGTRLVLAQVQVFQCRLNADVAADALAVRRSARPPRLPHVASGVATASDAKPLFIKNDASFTAALAGAQPPTVPVILTRSLAEAIAAALPQGTMLSAAAVEPFVAAAMAKSVYPVLIPAPYTLQAQVNTTTGNFVAIPRYLVRIAGPRVGLPMTTGPSKTESVYLEPVIDVQTDPTATNHLRFTIVVNVLFWIPSPEAYSELEKLKFVPTVKGPAGGAAAVDFYKAWSVVWAGIEG